MKTLFTILVLFLFTTIQAQWTANTQVRAGNSEMVIVFTGSLDSLGGSDSTLTSNAFDIEDYDGETVNFTLYRKLTSAVSVPKITAILYASEDGGTYTATTDTLLNADSLETTRWSTFTIQLFASFFI